MSLSPGVKDFVAGTVGGVAQVLAGHPLDTLKVRLQTQSSSSVSTQSSATSRYHGAWGCLRLTLKEEGVRGLFKGVTSPIAGVSAVNAVLFFGYGTAKRFFKKRHTEKRKLNSYEIAACGAFAGFVNCIVINPVELIKARLQVQYADPKPLYKGPLDVIRQTVAVEGVLGLGRGMVSCIYREVPCYAAYFVFFEIIKRQILIASGADTSVGAHPHLSPVASLLAGGMAGTCGWIVSYPQDVVKSRIQVEALKPKPKAATPATTPSSLRLGFIGSFIMDPAREWDGGFLRETRAVIHRSGWRGLWVGFTPCILRSFPANAATFLAYDTTIHVLNTMHY